MQHGVHLYICSCAMMIMMMMIVLIVVKAGDPFSDHINVNNIIEDSLFAFGFSVSKASSVSIGECRPTCLVLQQPLRRVSVN